MERNPPSPHSERCLSSGKSAWWWTGALAGLVWGRERRGGHAWLLLRIPTALGAQFEKEAPCNGPAVDLVSNVLKMSNSDDAASKTSTGLGTPKSPVCYPTASCRQRTHLGTAAGVPWGQPKGCVFHLNASLPWPDSHRRLLCAELAVQVSVDFSPEVSQGCKKFLVCLNK